jgi:hypothetical protein
MAAPQKNQKRLGPLEKPLKMTDMCSPLTCNTTKVKCKRRRIRKRRTVPTRRLRRDKKRRKRRD